MKKTIIGSMVIISALLLSACSFGRYESLDIVTDEYDFDENIESIDIDIAFEDIHIMPSDDDMCHIVFTHPDSPKTTVEVRNNTLVISENEKTLKLPKSSDLNDTKLDIYIPLDELDDISIDSANSDITISNIVADTININIANGDVTFEESDAETIDIDVANGDVAGTLLSGKDFNVETAIGSVNVPNDSEGGRCTIDIAVGDIDLEVE